MDPNKKCQGCGAIIQTTTEDKAGFTPKSSLKNEHVLCRRCFRLKHYNETEDILIDDDDFFDMISSIRSTDSLVVHLIDVFDVNGSMIKNLSRIVGNNPVILVGNKMDLLPKSTNRRKLTQWLRSSAREAGIKIVDLFLISSTKGHGIDELTKQIDRYRNGQDVYIVGTTNVGKSTFINRLIKQTTGESDVITTSYFPGTTLGFIEIPLDDRTYLIDTPGIVNRDQMAHYVSDKDLKLITPTKEVKSRVYQLNDQQTLFFGGLARLDFLKGEKQSLVCYFSNELTLHRTKLDNADELYENQLGKLLSPPNRETIKNIQPLVEQTYNITEAGTDIVFPGLGWVTIRDQATVKAYSPEGVAISIRKSFV